MQIKRSKYTIFGTHQLPINYQINKYSTLILEFKSKMKISQSYAEKSWEFKRELINGYTTITNSTKDTLRLLLIVF
jgi:hypothetical protein